MRITNPNTIRCALLQEIRTRLQEAHFAARGFTWPATGEREAVADQLHAIRILAEELNGLL